MSISALRYPTIPPLRHRAPTQPQIITRQYKRHTILRCRAPLEDVPIDLVYIDLVSVIVILFVAMPYRPPPPPSHIDKIPPDGSSPPLLLVVYQSSPPPSPLIVVVVLFFEFFVVVVWGSALGIGFSSFISPL